MTIDVEKEASTHEHTPSLHSTIDESPADKEISKEEIAAAATKLAQPTPPLMRSEGIRSNWRGWLAVVSTFLVNFFCFGTIFAWGNFQQLYLEVYAGQTNTFAISFVGTMASAILLCSAIFLTPVIQRLGYRGTMAIGMVLAPLGLILASYATQLWHIYLSQGLLYGIGSGLAFAPSLALPSQFFVRHRSLATGLAVAGSGIGGVSISPMVIHLIQALGYRQAIRVLGAFGFGILVIAVALAFSLRRPPNSGRGYFASMVDTRLLDHDFSIILVFTFLVPFGYLGPYFVCPQYATYLGYDATTGANLVSIMSGLNSVSRIVMGFLADRFGKFNTIVVTTILAGIFPMVLWQFSHSYGVYVLFCVLYGFTSSVFVSLLPPILADVVGVENIQVGIGMSYMLTFFGSLVGPPLIGMLLQQYGWTAAIQFSGAPTVASGLVILYLRMCRSKGKLLMVI